LEKYAEYSDRYKEQVEGANVEKRKIREEINMLEVEVRRMRDTLADKQTENRNLETLLEHEHDLAEAKAEKEAEALELLSQDLGT
jgi:hypothetical protein